MITKAMHAIFKRWGGSTLKQRIWDREYASGKWNFLEDELYRTGDRDIVLPVIEQYSPGVDILDLGCGTGVTGIEIADTYRNYTGVDVSAVAISRANHKLRRYPGRKQKNVYVAWDIFTFVPDRSFSIILFRESIYYFPLRQIEQLLARYSSYLTAGGVFIVRLHDRERYRDIVEFAERQYRVCGRVLSAHDAGVVLVFSPKAKSPAGNPATESRLEQNLETVAKPD